MEVRRLEELLAHDRESQDFHCVMETQEHNGQKGGGGEHSMCWVWGLLLGGDKVGL
ncbi:hypothetical protein Pmar_PMAR024286 [Perkinsus marinus ATCC 50983]|uniref:Uncharacterized protein n=1 Tax=Perkinsus marinus (strain ATCC 50983 / TXsc) TaxID=423536 RepID=C5L412_PERM5|nr:hypothetical protein Pmar_PMAR024286 [Perkinsus marinus ATCC 50983]EER08530.1 hypothetical protein Pmar_PMAR024286 [Perkinsus marinus ATCC 50983]|eukprot:XP_002776714.1 hypothetical protein Pmar_PMAR024286 [Perkinsus marinus ATCC 50983]